MCRSLAPGCVLSNTTIATLTRYPKWKGAGYSFPFSTQDNDKEYAEVLKKQWFCPNIRSTGREVRPNLIQLQKV